MAKKKYPLRVELSTDLLERLKPLARIEIRGMEVIQAESRFFKALFQWRHQGGEWRNGALAKTSLPALENWIVDYLFTRQ